MTATMTGFSEADRAELAFVLESLEANHADTLLFVATQQRRHDRDTFTEAAFAAIDRTGIDFRLSAPDGESVERIDFDADASSLHQVQGRFFELLTRARQAFPDDPVSSLEEQYQLSTTLTTYVGTVVRVHRITPSFIEVTIGGLDGMPDLGGDEFSYVMRPSTPDAIAQGALMSEIGQLPAGTFVGGTYTTRRRRLDAGELDLWIFLHGHDGGVSGWAAGATPGDTVALWGPRRSYEPPPTTTSHLFVCDETGLPAAFAIIETLPAVHPIILVAEVTDAEHRPPLPAHPGLTTQWVHRDQAHQDGARLLDVLRATELPEDGLYAFGAAESHEISAVRRYLRNERHLPATQVHMTGYWRR